MKTNKIKAIFFTVVLCVLVLLIIIFSMKLISARHKESEYNKENDNKLYLLNKDKEPKKIQHLKIVEANDINMKNVDTYLNGVQFNGSITILDRGKLVFNKGYGYRNIKKGIKNTPDTMYLIGSAQKFTTGLILKKLELENKVNINDPVSKYLPWFKTSKTITLKDLMLHRSGLFKFEASPKSKSLESAVHMIQQRGIDNKFYHKHLYNDANYLVLAQVIEKVTHKSYVENYYEEIAKPNDLNNSAFFNEKPYQKYMATGYKIINNKLKTMHPTILDQYYGAGNLFMTTYDMAHLVRNLQQNKIFNESTTTPLLQQMGSTMYPESYRYGFYVSQQRDRINGVFFGQIFTVYFNQRYIVVMGTNIANDNKVSNENKISHIYDRLLNQTSYYSY
ncbi:class A beta-lactamase-related serine hydrolase [Staphylococcus pragensis]|uniref:Class A beta-lactamase-related serine hydrolase n=1 Tax=Staphylococcus pragensis TaxID=1611836 RepID=A0A4Z1BRK5_9STAP|nr:serine hydrolase domain-containing protein [Staphylococcus pragensis]RTX90876.1 class A beta-lactamase-related serine hydrolase [Staphylococcus carnosus]TGN28450.1 class A beta-lactamase-related serine hydrolase [Staphylococcus pragensis]GGG87502.1 methicillin resistance protein FmtA [Staphylococcus pragensis]